VGDGSCCCCCCGSGARRDDALLGGGINLVIVVLVLSLVEASAWCSAAIVVLVLSLVGASAWWAMVGAAGAVVIVVLVHLLGKGASALGGGGYCCMLQWCSLCWCISSGRVHRLWLVIDNAAAAAGCSSACRAGASHRRGCIGVGGGGYCCRIQWCSSSCWCCSLRRHRLGCSYTG
jgi:hypothetical protein